MSLCGSSSAWQQYNPASSGVPNAKVPFGFSSFFRFQAFQFLVSLGFTRVYNGIFAFETVQADSGLLAEISELGCGPFVESALPRILHPKQNHGTSMSALSTSQIVSIPSPSIIFWPLLQVYLWESVYSVLKKVRVLGGIPFSTRLCDFFQRSPWSCCCTTQSKEQPVPDIVESNRG